MFNQPGVSLRSHRLLLICLFAVFAGALCQIVTASDDGKTNAVTGSKFPCDPADAAHYTAYHISQPITIDGQPDEPVWQAAPRTPRFSDIITGQPTIHDTRAALLWDDTNLYISYWVEEPDVKATFTKHNSPIYENNDVELFIAGRDSYYELEINALNTIYEVFFMWEDTYEQDGFAAVPEFQRSNPAVRPFNGIAFTDHPRGRRLGSWAWRFPGIQTAVNVDGTLNDARDRDRGWNVEIALPWNGMKWLAKPDDRSLPPKDGDIWRIDLSRFNHYKAPTPFKDSGGWFMSRHGVWDSHLPECFPYIHFSTNDVMAVKAAKPANG